MKRAIFVWALLTVVSIPSFGDDEDVSPAESITLAELRDHMFFLASDYLAGRVVGTEGYRIAAEYGVSQFVAAGLEPLSVLTGGEEGFLQPVPLQKRAIVGDPLLQISAPAGQCSFESGDEVKMVFLRGSGEPVPVVFVGYGIEEPDHGWNDYEGLDVAGKAIVMINGAPVRDGEPVLPAEIHARYASPRGAQIKIFGSMRKGPAVVIMIADQMLVAMWDMIPSEVNESSFTLAGQERQDNLPTVLGIKENVAAKLFEGQRYDPATIAQAGLEGYCCYELEGATVWLEFDVERSEVQTNNVAAVVRGTDPELAGEYVVVGAHLDHIPPQGGQVCNGADDNASGSIGVIEVAEAVAMAPPRRSVIFILYAAEEVGLYGSRHFVNNCPVPLESIVANINLDMIARTDGASGDTRAHYVKGADARCPELKEIVQQVNARSVNWPLTFETEPGGNSDHFPYHQQGIPVMFFFSGSHQHLHTPTDDPETIEYDKMLNITRLVYEITMELANRDSRPCASR